MHSNWLVGIDEVGRGPLAGPVAVGAVLVAADFAWSHIDGVTDSKQLTSKKREEIAVQAQDLMRHGQLRYSVAMTTAPVIDQIGIVRSIDRALVRSLQQVVDGQSLPYEEILVKLDGGLRAPQKWVHQETIIKGDAREPVIGLASIVAKVARDTYMRQLAGRAAYGPYDFGTNKGYGTRAHRAAIAQNGFSDVHRQSYCRNIELL